MRLSAFTHMIFRARNWKPRKSEGDVEEVAAPNLASYQISTDYLSSTLANLDNAGESAFAVGDFSCCLGLAVTVKKLMHPVFCASIYR